jgi:hypothetical protein
VHGVRIAQNQFERARRTWERQEREREKEREREREIER